MTGPKTVPMPAVPRLWTTKSPTRMTTVIGTMNGSKTLRGDAEAFDRAQHRDRRRDHAVAVEQRRAEQSDRDERAVRRFAALRSDERDQRQDAALALVVGAHDEEQVLDRDRDDERPEDQRQDAEHVVGASPESACVPEKHSRSAYSGLVPMSP